MNKYLLSFMLFIGIILSLGNTASWATVTMKPKKAPTGIIMEYSIETESGKTIQKPKTVKYSPTWWSLPKEVRDAMTKLWTWETTSVVILDEKWVYTWSKISLLKIVPYVTPTLPRKYFETSYTDTIDRKYIGNVCSGCMPWDPGSFIPAKNLRIGETITWWAPVEFSYFNIIRDRWTLWDNAKIIKIEGDMVTINVANPQH